jgi:hypothetical protein
MLNYLLRILPALVVASTASAQTFETAWFGTVGAGIAVHDNGAFSRRLASYTPLKPNGENRLYQTEPFFGTGGTWNAGVGLLVGRNYFIGVSGETVSYATAKSIVPPETPQDEYMLSGSGGGLDLGYALVNRDGVLVVPYVQAGYYGYSLDYHNAQNDSIPFFEGTPVAPGTTATFTGAAPRVALGIGLMKFLGSPDADGSQSGLVLCARLTWGVMPSRPSWEQNGTKVDNGGLTPAYNGVALSISIGGGMGWP